jgi:hypothetical protein
LHYFFDLVVAFPFALAIQAVCLRSWPAAEPRRRRALLGGVLLVVVWFVVLRYGLALLTYSPVLTAAAALVTVAASVFAERGLYWAALAASQQDERGQPLGEPDVVPLEPLPSPCPDRAMA